MQTSRDIVSATLHFSGPERIAHSFEPSDFVWTSYTCKTYATSWQQAGASAWYRLDEWGNQWKRIDQSSKGEVSKGILPSLSAVHQYQFPDFSNPADYESVRADRAAHPNHWLIGSLPGFTFNIARKFRRLDQYLLELAAEPDLIHQLHDRIDEILMDMIQNYAIAGVDAVMFPEDWGTQLRTLISPTMWRNEFYPRFIRLCSLAHSHQIKVFMHSCGQIKAIIPDLIQSGIDLLQLDQPDLIGIDCLAGIQQQQPITYWCPVDIQKTLQTRDESTIRSKALEMLSKLWNQQGGFIAGYYSDNTSIGLDPIWQEIASQAFLEFGSPSRRKSD